MDAAVTNRELASLILIGAFFVFVLVGKSRGKTLGAFRSILETLGKPVLLVPLISYTAWILLSLVPASRLGLWDPSLWKPTILWVLLSGFALLMNLNKAIGEDGHFRQTMIQTIEVSAFVEFFATLKSFPLWIEIPGQLLAVLFAGVVVVAREPDQQPVKKLANGYLVLFGLGALSWSAVALISNWTEIDRSAVLLDLLLPVWLTPVAMIFVYIVAVYAAHEVAWKRLTIWNKNSLWRQKLAIALRCNIRLGSLRLLRGQTLPALARASGFKAAWQEIGEARERECEQAKLEAAAIQRLIDNAGLKGVDETGQELDQREFEETRRALRWLATCQMGQHRNSRGRYRSDIVAMVESAIVKDGLPTDHGVSARVSKDGQKWYGWRQTPSGRWFGIGAAAGPPDQWLFDGDEPPDSFPTEDSWDHFAPGERSVNWD